eukprot:9489309-Pyramimonas_sp.AAC.1
MQPEPEAEPRWFQPSNLPNTDARDWLGSINGGQLETLLADANVKFDPVTTSKVFMKYTIAGQAQAMKRREGAMNRSLETDAK